MKEPRLLTKARYLRNNQTPAEKILWQELKNNKLGKKFRRQHPLSKFVLDFYAPKARLAIELDGEQHEDMRDYDKLRTEFLNSKNIKLLRFWNYEVESSLEKVLDKISKTLSI